MVDLKKIVAIFQKVELRVFIIMSTFLQIFLTIWTNMWGNISSQSLRRIIWIIAYIAAEFSATLTLGGIFQENLSSGPRYSSKNAHNTLLSALWAPFILLHLGGHNKMTTFSLADNEYWLKHVLRFLCYEFTALLICISAFNDTRVAYPSSILFIIGTLKFGERILALKWGNFGFLRDKLLKEEFEDVPQRRSQAHRRGVPEFPHPNIIDLRVQPRHDDIQLKRLCNAFNSFEQSKGIYTDGDPLHYTRGANHRIERFDEMESTQVFSQIEKELSFAHDFFYTKTFTSHTIGGWIIRVLSLASVISAITLFGRTDKVGFSSKDVSVTYLLLIVTLSHELFSFLEAVLSNYTMVQVIAQENWRHVELTIKRLRIAKGKLEKLVSWVLRTKRSTIGQFGIVDYGIDEPKASLRVKTFFDHIGLKEFWHNYRHTRYVSLYDHTGQRDCIFIKVRETLQRQLPERYEGGPIPVIFPTLVSNNVTKELEGVLRENAENRNFEECVIVWHIATYVCFKGCAPSSKEEECPSELVCAKFLSEHVLYLLRMHSSMVSLLATDNLRSYRTVCSVLVQEFETENGQEICDRLASVVDMGGPEKLVAQGCKVAEELKRAIDNEGNVTWDLLFCLWVDVLCFAAINCEGERHVEQLGGGGQLLTYVWLFLKHLVGDWCTVAPLNIVIE